MKNLHILQLFRNRISIAGVLILSATLAVGLPLLLVDIVFGHANPYAGILTYMILPIGAFIGTFIAVAGAILNFRRRQLHPDLPPFSFPAFDLNNPRHRQILFPFTMAGVAVLVLVAVTAYQGYHFTDSVQFCGQACHEPMKPEFTAYQHSPHARVACVSCHIGPGAGWFVRSKISGAYQVYSVLFNKYHRPIETPVKNLRPAQDTCEQCHWPAKFFGSQQKTFTYFLSDESNSAWQIQSLIKIGGGDVQTGLSAGIHSHMNIENQIFFKDSDGKRLTIPWVKSVNKNGKETEYISTENTLSSEELSRLPTRRMDCMDCHNRPSHIFHPPGPALDRAFASRLLNPSVPFLKREGVRVLSADYKTEPEGRKKIQQDLEEFYKSNYPKLWSSEREKIINAIETVQNVFSRTIFPEMKADWRSYPSHIGHWSSDGCFRCHDGLHQSSDGKVITNDCMACHTILAQGSPQNVAKARLQAQPFKHPVDIGVDVTQMKCSVCHSNSAGM